VHSIGAWQCWYHPNTRPDPRGQVWGCCGRLRLADGVRQRPDGCQRCDHTDDWFQHDRVEQLLVPELLIGLLRPCPEAVQITQVEVPGDLVDDPIAVIRSSSSLFSGSGGILSRKDIHRAATQAGSITAASLDSVQRPSCGRAQIKIDTVHAVENSSSNNNIPPPSARRPATKTARIYRILTHDQHVRVLPGQLLHRVFG
jgi:hypothetical protein